MSSDLHEREAAPWTRRAPKTKEEKLELIREMKAQLMSGEKQPLDAGTF
jgi:hypothetical protein